MAAKSRLRSRTFDPLTLPDDDLELHNLCRDIAEASTLSENDALARIQLLQQRGDYQGAIRAIRTELRRHGIFPWDDLDVNRRRFALIRDQRRFTQKSLAQALNVTPAAICHFEKRQGTLSFLNLLLAAAVLGVRLSDFCTTNQ